MAATTQVRSTPGEDTLSAFSCMSLCAHFRVRVCMPARSCAQPCVRASARARARVRVRESAPARACARVQARARVRLSLRAERDVTLACVWGSLAVCARKLLARLRIRESENGHLSRIIR